MSILLKALKKSEAQRQVGQPPDIHAPVDLSEHKEQPKRRWLTLAMLSLIVVILAWISWQQYSQPGDRGTTGPDEVADESGAGSSSRDEQGTQPDSAGEPTLADIIDVRPAPPPQVANFPSGESTDSRESATESASEPQDAKDRRQRLSRSFAQYESTESSDPGEQSKSDKQGRSGSEVENDDVSDLETAAQALASVAPKDQKVSEVSRPRNSRVEVEQERVNGDSEPISYWQVPQSMRDRMPEFRITVLVYAEAPEDRFVLINGVRLKEKEELDSGVTLDEIRRDGAVFTYRDYRFLVKG